MTDTTKERAQTTRELAHEIANLAHYAWTDPKNAEYLFRKIEKRALEIRRRAEQSTETPPTDFMERVNHIAWMPLIPSESKVKRIREICDEWMLAEAPRPVQDEADFSIDKDQQCRKKVVTDMQGGWLKCQKAKGHTGKCDPNGYELAPRPIGTPEHCPSCGNGKYARGCVATRKGHALTHIPNTCDCVPCTDSWHDGPVGTPEENRG